ncbi:MAG: hypothetical protein ABFD02_05285 [Bacteroidales bacterium]
METKFGLVDLTENELKEKNGGLFLSIIMAFVSRDPFAIYKGIRDGYNGSTQGEN